jgi:sigma-B regulation protein RsbU (phosphoserine phosphatase)
MKEIQILSPDGQSRIVPLEGESISMGRSHNARLCFSDDAGLSKLHLAFERDGDDAWALRDLNSKNGTMLNGVNIAERTLLKAGDRIAAGHLIIIYDSPSSRHPKPVVVFDPEADTSPGSTSSIIVSDLTGVFRAGTASSPAETLASNHVSALIRAGNELAGHRPLQELFPFILDLAMEAVKADRGVLMTLENGELQARANKGEGFRISTTVRDRLLNTGVSVLVRDASLDDALKDRRSIVEQNIRTLMAVPLQTSDQIIGIIYVDSPFLMCKFTKDDLNLLTVMANVAAIRIEQARFAERDKERQIMDREYEQAAEIQQSLLPSVAPAIRGLDLAGHNAPCRTVGGDYFDFFPFGQSRVAMVLGDVAGKGMPASLLMMGLQARVQVMIEKPESLAEVMTRLNRITCANCPLNRFITLFFCILDGDTGELTYCNAGHNRPVIVRAGGEHEELPGGGPVIGILRTVEYQEYRARLGEGDVLVIYSDGITEAANPAGEEFEIEGLAAAVTPHRNSAAATIIAAINQAVRKFTAGAPQADDITLIAARRVAA